MGNSKSKQVEKPEPPKPCTVPACGKPMFCQGYCQDHQHRALTTVYGTTKNGFGGFKNKSATNDSQSRSNHNSARMVELAQLVCSPRHRG